MPENRRPIAVDLFAGAGGLSLGFEQAGFDVLAAVEIDPVHCAVHEFNFPHCAMICRSVANVSGDQIREASTIGRRDVDVVFGGPPCQGVSLMGKRALDDPRNGLMQHFVRLVLEIQPRYFVMENVRGLTIGGHKRILEEVIEAFRCSGYEVREKYQVLNAAEYGVPQDRHRLFLMGCRQGETLPEYPDPTAKPAGARRVRRDLFDLSASGPTVWDAIGDIPDADHYPELLERDWTDVEFGAPSAYAATLRCGKESDDFSYKRPLDLGRLTSSMRTVHTPVSIERFSATPNGQIEPISRFPKLDPNGICNTLRAGTGSDHGAYTSPRPLHPVYPRCITVREAARIHSYPDWFRLHVTKWHGFRQIGNSVPPRLGRAVASQIVEALGVQIAKPTAVMNLGDERLLSLKMTEAALRYSVDRSVMGKRTRKIAGGIRELEIELAEGEGNAAVAIGAMM